jgi:hypothetical protein
MRSKAREIDIQPTDHVAFIHIPKTAGTTLNAAIEPLLAGLSSCPEYFLAGLVQSELDDLRKFQVFRGHFPYALFSDVIFPEGFIGLTFLRDPVERTTSNYRFIHDLLKRDGPPVLPQYADEFEQIKHLTLVELLERTDLRINKDLVNFQTGFMGSSVSSPAALPAFLPKLFPWGKSVTHARYNQLRSRVKETFGMNENGEITRTNLNIAKQRLKEIAFLGLVEKFQDSLFLLSYTFGWRPIWDTTRLNATPDKGDSASTNPEVLEQIRDSVGLDLELYRFGQDIFERRFNDMTQSLLQRYGKKKHAALRWPLLGDVMAQLLEQNYIDRRDRRARQAGPLASEYLYRPAMKVEGPFGWYKPDFSPAHGRMCWSGPGLHSGFDLPCPSGTNIRVSFRVLMALQPAIIEQLSLTLNNIPVELDYFVDPDGAFVFTGEIPSAAVSELFVRLVFSVPVTVVPGTVDPDNRDPRHLGILLNWVKLQAH